ncbi:vWA domain-containing protein [Nannocystis bainbridge]|uniref:VWA domain-containing protein n=1 Tax=Nannocystis bainbridge TaxID=2995303 RepID=A0ABT5DTW7_9BACT|nr:VWA domain-containing protein [Nannocystis bainbridge]MDC0717060.1 VWA domain-containing protein [Nannocystis bainbridge]
MTRTRLVPLAVLLLLTPACAKRAGYHSDAAGGYGATATAAMEAPNSESYAHVAENAFKRVADDPLSTFSIDVDTASYSNVRRFLEDGQLPPADAVRIEEMINYFSYAYPEPAGAQPFSVRTEVAACPWNDKARLVQIGIKGKSLAPAEIPPRNLVFLLDVSGSMASPDKLPLLQRSLTMLVADLRPVDSVGIVVYAGAAGVVLEPTSDRDAIVAAIDRLYAGGATNGGQGIEAAYALAQRSFRKGGINRVILATDGDFNVGVSSEGALQQLIERKRDSGIFLSVLGFGTGNVKDSTMELLADKGNGNYAYIDGLQEARKVLVEQAGATLVTIAKDVKIQVEFNPLAVGAYRLVGYENRMLAHQDFNDDRKDAGEIGAGHTVTALYEVLPPGAEGAVPGVDPLRYQRPASAAATGSGELMHVKLRFKPPEGDDSQLLTMPVADPGSALDAASDDLRFAAAVAMFGMKLRNSEHAKAISYRQIRGLAEGALGPDPRGYRRGMLALLGLAAGRQGEPLEAPVGVAR